jgi:hypothetical protein
MRGWLVVKDIGDVKIYNLSVTELFKGCLDITQTYLKLSSSKGHPQEPLSWELTRELIGFGDELLINTKNSYKRIIPILH